MSYNNFMSKVRYLDNLVAKWLMRHFYFLFFQIVLMAIFLFWFVNTIQIIDSSLLVSKTSALERILMTQSVNTSIIVLLLLLNSFWMLYIFNGIQRIANLLKDISYYTSRFRVRNK
jgi:membrane-associated HD superfamily phosphohydrolase